MEKMHAMNEENKCKIINTLYKKDCGYGVWQCLPKCVVRGPRKPG